jgi:sulfoxide reductase heme-binding subunit YedZ
VTARTRPAATDRPTAKTNMSEQTSAGEMLSLVAGAVIGGAAAVALASALVLDQPMPDEVTTLVWYAIRIAGVLAYLTLWLTTIAGLCISGGLFPKWGAVLLPVHQLADLALSLALLHAALLLGDRFAGFTPETIAVPFRAAYEPLWTGLGIIALYLGAVVFWSVHIRPRIGYARWRAIHYGAFVVYALALAHGIFAGTDSSSAVMRLMYAATGAAVVGLTFLRTASLRRQNAAKARKEETAVA